MLRHPTFFVVTLSDSRSFKHGILMSMHPFHIIKGNLMNDGRISTGFFIHKKIVCLTPHYWGRSQIAILFILFRLFLAIEDSLSVRIVLDRLLLFCGIYSLLCLQRLLLLNQENVTAF